MKQIYQITTTNAIFEIIVTDDRVTKSTPYGQNILLNKSMSFVNQWCSRTKSKIVLVKEEPDGPGTNHDQVDPLFR